MELETKLFQRRNPLNYKALEWSTLWGVSVLTRAVLVRRCRDDNFATHDRRAMLQTKLHTTSVRQKFMMAGVCPIMQGRRVSLGGVK